MRKQRYIDDSVNNVSLWLTTHRSYLITSTILTTSVPQNNKNS